MLTLTTAYAISTESPHAAIMYKNGYHLCLNFAINTSVLKRSDVLVTNINQVLLSCLRSVLVRRLQSRKVLMITWMKTVLNNLQYDNLTSLKQSRWLRITCSGGCWPEMMMNIYDDADRSAVSSKLLDIISVLIDLHCVLIVHVLML